MTETAARAKSAKEVLREAAKVKTAKASVRMLARSLDKLDEQYVITDDELNQAMARAYKTGVSAIELAGLTGFTRSNIYDRLKRVGKYAPQQPKKEAA